MKRSTFKLGLRVINIPRTMTGGLNCSLGETARIKETSDGNKTL